jgi:hypothetical protein
VPDQTDAKTVIGPATFNGHSATEIDELSSITEFGITSTQSTLNYDAITSDGYVNYGRVASQSGPGAVVMWSGGHHEIIFTTNCVRM